MDVYTIYTNAKGVSDGCKRRTWPDYRSESQTEPDESEPLACAESDCAERIYEVDPVQKTCTCPDHKEAGFTCKHIHAVKFTIERETRKDGTIIETRSITLTEKKIYRQDWVSYNLAQTTERHRFSELLFDLCKGIPPQVREPGQAVGPAVQWPM